MDKQLRASILERLQRHRQAATFGALAGVVGGIARSVMSDLPRNYQNSWVVNKKTKEPPIHKPNEIDPNLVNSIKAHGVIEKPSVLRRWLATHP
jgi:hypothetical protein